MSFTITLAAQRFVTDGLFVLYFPDDFDQRRKFFTFMWLDGHPQDQPGTGLEALDAIISSVKVKPQAWVLPLAKIHRNPRNEGEVLATAKTNGA